ncbi:hypothetical protein V6R21_08185 [Limibacter armeniacum]|uniref:hypothetical protein n=1 Tax=Limibacter armeniacum TaxID=466084 RepID=UPI002FE67C27
MLKWFRSQSSDSREDILNKGYKMSLEFGGNWLKPINERLGKKYPKLSSNELDEFSAICERLRAEAINFINKYLEAKAEGNQQIVEKELQIAFTNWALEYYPWLSKSNIKGTVSQGLYFAWKGGLVKQVK